MEWLICGTLPDPTFPLTLDTWHYQNGRLCGKTSELSVHRGTPALMASCALACQTLGVSEPSTLLVGDIGDGNGSRNLYTYLAQALNADWNKSNPKISGDSSLQSVPQGITFHYLFPDVDGHNRVLMAIDSLASRPILVADAGFMYVAKMSGYASKYDLFTPDLGELAFLADEKAPHPFYTRGFLLSTEQKIDDLARRASDYDNSAQYLLVKGETDFIVEKGTVLDKISSPCIPFMEPIGGTGDMVTGIATALLSTNFSMKKACSIAAITNRLVGEYAQPTPATQVSELLPYIPQVLTDAIKKAE